MEIESLVLASQEARELAVSEQKVDAALGEIAARYASRGELLADLAANGLGEKGLRRALHRELLFDAVMARVGARHAPVSDVDVRLFYYLHGERFRTPERRKASHILVTINPDFPENTRAAALTRIEQALQSLAGQPRRFAEVARRQSECPTALQGGRLGHVVRGQLYPPLDQVLFRMGEGEISAVVESEVGFHLLLCEKIEPPRSLPLSKARPRIEVLLRERNVRSCQRAWIAELRARQAEEAAAS